MGDLASVERTIHVLAATMPCSNMRLAVAMPGKNTKCLCQGPSMVFKRMGSIPSVMVMDNATGAVQRDGNGEVTLTNVFAAFVSHHRMQVRFRNRYSATRGAMRRTPSDNYTATSWSPSTPLIRSNSFCVLAICVPHCEQCFSAG